MYSACLPEHRRNREMGNVDLPENLLTRAYPSTPTGRTEQGHAPVVRPEACSFPSSSEACEPPNAGGG